MICKIVEVYITSHLTSSLNGKNFYRKRFLNQILFSTPMGISFLNTNYQRLRNTNWYVSYILYIFFMYIKILQFNFKSANWKINVPT